VIEAWGPLTLAVVAICVLLYGFSKTAMPVAGVVAGPFLAAALGATTASGFVMPLLLIGDLIALSRYRQHVNWRLIWRIAPGVIIGILFTALLFRVAEVTTLNRVIGVLILLSVALEMWRRRRPVETGEPPTPTWRNRALSGFFGILTGMTTMAANAGGTAMTLYLVNMRVSMLAFMGTSVWFFLFMNLLKMPFLIGLGFLTTDTLIADLFFLPLIGIGAWLGVVVFDRMNERVFTLSALVLSAAGAMWLIIHG